MADETRWFVGVDWASEQHQVCLLDADGHVVGEHVFAHGGEGLAALCAWLVATTGDRSDAIAVAIELPHDACNRRLADAVYPCARVASQRDEVCRARYSALRQRGHRHGRALRTVVDRLLKVACTLLERQTVFDPGYQAGRAAQAG